MIFLGLVCFLSIIVVASDDYEPGVTVLLDFLMQMNKNVYDAKLVFACLLHNCIIIYSGAKNHAVFYNF